tara:strand:+ start:244 stop:858 length:615 start_codon:yes stop_codon:yes gene_type:complete
MANIKLQEQAEITPITVATEDSRTDIVKLVENVVTDAIDGIYAEHLEADEIVTGLTIRAEFTPNKENGQRGKWEAVKIETLTLDDGTEREFVTTCRAKSFPSQERAIAFGYAYWPEVRLPESKRIEAAITAATATFLGKIQKGVMAARQMTRAYALCDAEVGLSVNDALERVREQDTKAVDSANEKSTDAPTAVTTDSDDSVFE